MHKRSFTSLRFISAFLMLSFSGCATYTDLPAGTVKQVSVDSSSPLISRETVVVNTAADTDSPPSNEYRIGINDVLYVNVNGKQEFLVAPGNANSKVQGSRVDGTGTVHLPIVGGIKVVGLTTGEAQKTLQEAFRRFLQDPWIVVEVAEYKSQPIYLLGQFRAPGTYYMDRPLTLLQGIALGGGFDSAANLRAARITRNNRILPVDIYDLLTRGDASQNTWLKAGDTIYLSDNRSQQVFVFGAVKKPGPIVIPNAGLNLAQAIASAELRDTGFNHRQVRIIRSLSTTKGELMVVDFEKVLKGDALPMQLVDGDVVFLPKSGVGNWNDALAEMLPSLQAISALLQPFVQIKFLSQ